MRLKNIIIILVVHAAAQDIVKHGVIFKHENLLLASHNAWKIFMKLDPKPFETLFQQVTRLEKNTNELKESIFQFLRSDKGLQASKMMHSKDNKEFQVPTIPKLKSKFIIDDFDKKMAEIDMALGTGTRENRKKRSTNKVERLPKNFTAMKPIESPKPLTPRKGKLYDGNYALLNEIPSLWTFLKELWQNHAEKNVTKQILSKLAKEKDYRQIINLKELKFSNTQQDNRNENPTEGKEKDTKTTTPVYEESIREIQSSMTETTTSTVPEMSALGRQSPKNLTTLTYLKPTIITKWTWSEGPTFTRTQLKFIFTIGLRARTPVKHTETQTIKVQAVKPKEKKNNYEKEEENDYVHKKCWTIDGKRACARLAMADEPAKEDIEPLPDLNEKNAQKVSTHQAFLILYKQRLQALFELFNTEIQKLKQSTTRIFEVFFRRSKYRRSTSLIRIIGELASQPFLV
jgi:hypothetical protein